MDGRPARRPERPRPPGTRFLLCRLAPCGRAAGAALLAAALLATVVAVPATAWGLAELTDALALPRGAAAVWPGALRGAAAVTAGTVLVTAALRLAGVPARRAADRTEDLHARAARTLVEDRSPHADVLAGLSRSAADTARVRAALASAGTPAVAAAAAVAAVAVLLVLAPPVGAAALLGAAAAGHLLRGSGGGRHETGADGPGPRAVSARAVRAYGMEDALARGHRPDPAAPRGARRGGVAPLPAGGRRAVVLAVLAVLAVGTAAGATVGGDPGRTVATVVLAAVALAGTGICLAWATRCAAALPAAARLAALVTAEPAPQDRPWARPLRRVRGDLRLAAVTVVDADGPLLAAADLHVRPGERVAVVGGPERTRAAVLDLLLRWRDPDAGQVSFDGHDLTELTLDTIRGAVAVVLPVPVPVAGTVADNIRIARPAAGRAEVRAAAETVRLDLRDLPLGLDTPLGADTLDDTRWRLVTIARAVLRDTPVLLAEDPLSGLPETGRRAVRDALDAACAGRTAVTLAADPAGIPPCDRVLRLDRGLLRGDPGTGRVRPRHRVSPGGTR